MSKVIYFLPRDGRGLAMARPDEPMLNGAPPGVGELWPCTPPKVNGDPGCAAGDWAAAKGFDALAPNCPNTGAAALGALLPNWNGAPGGAWGAPS